MTVNSATVTEAVRQVRRARQRAADQACGEYLCRRSAQEIVDDTALIEGSNDIALRDAQW